MALYELLLLGRPTSAQSAALSARISAVAAEFELAVPAELALRTSFEAHERDANAATAALYFAGDPEIDRALVDELERLKIPIIPVALDGEKIECLIPEAIRPTNGYFVRADDPELEGLAAALLECVGLLHEQRRVFVSYRRTESRDVAVQLHDVLSGRGFDVFLDTHDIRPGSPFQEMLFQKLADSDVVIMLDTADYFGSKWTTQEIGRALAKGAHILRLIWPGHEPSRHLNFANLIRLSNSDLDERRRLVDDVVDQVVNQTEHLRSRSIAHRHRLISGKLVKEVERIGGQFEGIGLHRSMALTLAGGKRLWAYPAVGIPTAQLLNDIHTKANRSASEGYPILVYDDSGIGSAWEEHLAWLARNIAAVQAVPVNDAAWKLVELDV